MAFLEDSFFGQFMNFAPHSLAQSFLNGDIEGDHVLSVTRDFGPNPGNLRMLSYVPEGIGRGAPLVVVLHGCRQTAGAYDRGTGWSQLANRFGFAVLYPEQQRANNANVCYNWFEPEDVTRDEGEVASIAAMIRFMLREHGFDAGRVFISGLSAGGGMTAAMLATYPELFAGASIIAGLPYGLAETMQDAFGVMGQGRIRNARDLGDRVRAGSPHRGGWPRVTLWQGDADHVVNPVNAAELAKQWTDVHGLADAAPEEELVGAFGQISHRIWRGTDGRPAVDLYTLPAFGHATPIDPMAMLEDARCGTPGASPFILPGGISSSYVMAESWGLTAGHRQTRVGRGIPPRFENHPLWQNLMPGGMTTVNKITTELTSPETLIGRVLRSTGIIDDGKDKK
ncbi:MAG TPA: PHB depolymerase family esterase [Acidisoma sp.]|nr:PHB depolymerase family esterase [Acidisoma sp.]